jgi:hypothetical protein
MKHLLSAFCFLLSAFCRLPTAYCLLHLGSARVASG